MRFNLEEIYGCTREEYMVLSNTTPKKMVKKLEAEVDQLKRSLKQKRSILVWQEVSTGDPVGIRLVNLVSEIEKKVNNKTKKIKDIKKEFNLC